MKLSLIGGVAALAALSACAPAHGPHDHDPAAKAHADFAMMDANRDGVVTQAEFQSAGMVMWTRLDTDSNGILTPAELEADAWRDHDAPPPPAPPAPAYPPSYGQPYQGADVHPASEGWGRNEATVNGTNDPQTRMPYARTH